MVLHLLPFALFATFSLAVVSAGPGFVYNGFHNVNLSRDGIAEIATNGLLVLTNHTRKQKGHAFYPEPFNFKNSSSGEMFSFSTSFVCAIVPEYHDIGGHGIVFVISPSKNLSGALPSNYLGLFNEANNGNPSNHVVAVELDTIVSSDFSDINDNHVGIDINDLHSSTSAPAMYYLDQTPGGYKDITLISGELLQGWIEYNGLLKHLYVTIAPMFVPKPKIPLLSFSYNLSSVILDSMYVGFSSSTGFILNSHYILGWSFQMNGQAQELDLSHLPKLPQRGPKEQSKLTIALPATLIAVVLILMSCLFLFIQRKRKYTELLEDWELNYGPHRFSYKDLYIATKGFSERELLGVGGFGRVYKGVLSCSEIEVAVKRVSHDSRQGIKEFIAEIVSIGKVRHRNLLQLHGYCRRKGELFLVYDFMPNGSLDNFLFRLSSPKLNWSQRFQIIQGVAAGLVYLHEQWEQVVIHRDIKASNVLLDGEFNAKLGDFGLARLYDHGTNPHTTGVAGTFGYLAPETSRTGKATTSSDVYAFGAFLLEVACGRRPIAPRAQDENVILVDWVVSCWGRGTIVECLDPILGSEYVKEEAELVLKLGLLCSYANPTARPNMRQVIQFLDKDRTLPEISSLGVTFGRWEGFDTMCFPVVEMQQYTETSSLVESVLSTGR